MNTNNKKLIFLAILIALNVAISKILLIPTPGGFITVMDGLVFTAASLFGKKEGAIVGGLSGFLLDIVSGYPQWMLFSLVIHGTQGYLSASTKSRTLNYLLATSLMVIGYGLANMFFYGPGGFLPSLLPNLLQNISGIIIATALVPILSRVLKVNKR